MIKILSKMVFVVMGAFHFLFNYALFMFNYVQGNTRWIYDNNSIGEATLEAMLMTIFIPFFFIGLAIFIRDVIKTIPRIRH